MHKITFLITAFSACMGYAWGKHSVKKEIHQKSFSAQKHLSIYKPWLDKMQRGENITDFIAEKMYDSVAIYGMGKLGINLINELKSKGIKIAYIIDQRAEEIFYKDIEVYAFTDVLPKVSAVIITTVNDQRELKEKIMSHMKCDVYMLEELVME